MERKRVLWARKEKSEMVTKLKCGKPMVYVDHLGKLRCNYTGIPCECPKRGKYKGIFRPSCLTDIGLGSEKGEHKK